MPPDSLPGFKAISLAQRISSPFVLWHCLLTASRARSKICTNWSEGWAGFCDKLPPSSNKCTDSLIVQSTNISNVHGMLHFNFEGGSGFVHSFGGWLWGLQALGLLSMISGLHCEQCLWPGSKQPMLGKVKTPAVAKT